MNDLSAWDDVRRIANELELQIHLGGMDARERWHELQARIAKLEKAIADSEHVIEDAIIREAHEVRSALMSLRDDIYARARGDYMTGW